MTLILADLSVFILKRDERGAFLQHSTTKERYNLKTDGEDEAVMTIGRGPQNDIDLVAERISRSHLRIVYMNGVMIVRDLGSRWGSELIRGEIMPK